MSVDSSIHSQYKNKTKIFWIEQRRRSLGEARDTEAEVQIQKIFVLPFWVKLKKKSTCILSLGKIVLILRYKKGSKYLGTTSLLFYLFHVFYILFYYMSDKKTNFDDVAKTAVDTTAINLSTRLATKRDPEEFFVS